MKYKFFWSGTFSNWNPAKFTYKENEFENSEQAFMWEKANHFGDNESANEALMTPDPKEVKKIGRKVKNFSGAEWDKVRFDYMFDINMAKFTQNEKFKHELFKYENYVESSPVDTVWGIGMHKNDPGVEDPKNWKGLNLLGQVLDKVRETIISNEKKF